MSGQPAKSSNNSKEQVQYLHIVVHGEVYDGVAVRHSNSGVFGQNSTWKMPRSGEKELLIYFIIRKKPKQHLDKRQLLAFVVSAAFTIHLLKSLLHWSIISSNTMQSSKPWIKKTNKKKPKQTNMNHEQIDESPSDHYEQTLYGWTCITDGHSSLQCPMSNDQPMDIERIGRTFIHPSIHSSARLNGSRTCPSWLTTPLLQVDSQRSSLVHRKAPLHGQHRP